MQAVRKMSISIPGDLADRLEPWRNRMNVSGVCADAIRREIEILEAAFQSPAEEYQYAGVIERLRSEFSTDKDYGLGLRAGEKYAQYAASHEEFKEFERISDVLIERELEFSLPSDEERELEDLQESEDVGSARTYRRGWVAGMMTVWQQVKDRL